MIGFDKPKDMTEAAKQVKENKNVILSFTILLSRCSKNFLA